MSNPNQPPNPNNPYGSQPEQNYAQNQPAYVGPTQALGGQQAQQPYGNQPESGYGQQQAPGASLEKGQANQCEPRAHDGDCQYQCKSLHQQILNLI